MVSIMANNYVYKKREKEKKDFVMFERLNVLDILLQWWSSF